MKNYITLCLALLSGICAWSQQRYSVISKFDSLSQSTKYGLKNAHKDTLLSCTFDSYWTFTSNVNSLASYPLSPNIYDKQQAAQKNIMATYSSEGLLAFKSNNGYGFMDTTGNIVIPPTYENLSTFNNGLAFALKQGKWGAINRREAVVIPFEQDRITIHGNFYLLYRHDSTVVLNKELKAFFSCSKDTQVSVFSDKYLQLYLPNRQYQLINTKGEVVLLDDMEIVDFRWSYSCMLLKRGDKVGILNTELKTVYPPQYKSITLYGGIWLLQTDTIKGANYVYYVGNINGTLTQRFEASSIKEGGSFVTIEKTQNNQKLYGTIAYNRVISPHYLQIEQAKEYGSYFWVQSAQNQLWGIINGNDSIIQPFIYKRFWTKTGTQYNKAINMQGEVVVFTENFTEAVVQECNNTFSEKGIEWCFGHSGTRVNVSGYKNSKYINEVLDEATVSGIDYEIVLVKKGNKYGILTTQLDTLIPLVYKHIQFRSPYFIATNFNNQQTLFNYSCQKLFDIPPSNYLTVIGLNQFLIEQTIDIWGKKRYFMFNEKEQTSQYYDLIELLNGSDRIYRCIKNQQVIYLNGNFDEQHPIEVTTNTDMLPNGYVWLNDSLLLQAAPIIYSSFTDSGEYGNFHQNLVIVQNNNKFGLANWRTRQLAQPIVFDHIMYIVPPLEHRLQSPPKPYFIAQKDSSYSFFDNKGVLITTFVGGINYVKGQFMVVNNSYQTETISQRPPDYSVSRTFQFGYKIGLINNKGKQVLPIAFDQIDFSTQDGDIILATQNQQTTVFDTTGKQLFRYQNGDIRYMSKTAIAVTDSVTNKWGVKNADNQWIIPPQYDKIESLSNYSSTPFFKCYLNGQVGVISKNGEVIVMPQYDDIAVDGVFTLIDNGYKTMIDIDGNIAEPYPAENTRQQPSYYKIEKPNGQKAIRYRYSPFYYSLPKCDSVSRVENTNFFLVYRKHKVGLMDTLGLLCPIKYQKISIEGNFATLKSNKRVRFLDIKYRKTLKSGYTALKAINSFVFNYAVTKKNGKIEFYTNLHKRIITTPPILDYKTIDYSPSLIYQTTDKKWNCVSSYNDTLQTLNNLDTVYQAKENGFSYLIIKNNQQYGVVNRYGRVVLPIEQDSVKDNYYWKNQKMGYFSIRNNIYIPPIYDQINFPVFYKNQQFAYYNYKTQSMINTAYDSIAAPPIRHEIEASKASGNFHFSYISKNYDNDFVDYRKHQTQLKQLPQLVKKNERWFLLDTVQNLIPLPPFDSIYVVSNYYQLIWVLKKGNKYGWASHSGEAVIKPQYDSIYLSYKILKIRDKQQLAFVDFQDTLVHLQNVEQLIPLDEQVALFVKDNRYGLYNKTNNQLLIPPIFKNYFQGVFYNNTDFVKNTSLKLAHFASYFEKNNLIEPLLPLTQNVYTFTNLWQMYRRVSAGSK
jgi:hypothetical protein